jgi:hypothetical protein
MIQPGAVDATATMSIVLRTCVARALMDMTPVHRAQAVPDAVVRHFAAKSSRREVRVVNEREFPQRAAEIPQAC